MGTFLLKSQKNTALRNAKAYQWAKNSRKVQPIQGFKEIRDHQKNQPEFVWQKGCFIEAITILAMLTKNQLITNCIPTPQTADTECR
jgi:hypothetical protein